MLNNPEKCLEVAAKCIEIHRRVSSFIREGMKLYEIDNFIKDNLIDLKCRSAFLGYRKGLSKFPCQACLSVNDCIVHGTAGSYSDPLKATDLLKIDIGVIYDGYISDLGWSYAIKEKTEQTDKLMRCGKEAIKRGISKVGYNLPIDDYSKTVQDCIEKEFGLFVIEYLGGHFFGEKLHEKPFVPNSLQSPVGSLFPVGTIAIEPMIGYSTGRITQKGWPIYTADGSLSSHFEHNLLITEKETVLLSVEMEKLPEIIG